MKNRITVHPAYKIGRIDPKLFGGFLEPIGNWVYGGIWNKNHPQADDLGFRKDIMKLIRELGLTAVRLPGGNFTSGYEWQDSIGPVSQRKKHLDLAWHQIEPNEVGHDEYLAWAERTGTEPLYTINMGTGTVEDAIHLVEYTTFPGGTYWSDLRRKNGYEKPHPVKYWCLGNEMDGPWQIHSWEQAPEMYGVKVNEAAKAVKWIEPGAKTIVAGSSTPDSRTYPAWDLAVLPKCYNHADYLSLHYYHNALDGDIGALMNCSNVMEEFISREIAACDLVQTQLNQPKQMMIAFDEYGCNFVRQGKTTTGRKGAIDLSVYPEFSSHMEGDFRINDPEHPDPVDPFFGGILSALSLTSMLLTLIRHADRVKIGCMTIAIYLVGYDHDHVWKQIGYYPMQELIQYAKGISLRTSVEGETYDVPGYNINDFNQKHEYRNVSYLETAASLDEENGEAAVFVINKNWERDLETEIDLTGFEGYHLEKHVELTAGVEDRNTAEDPEKAVPVVNPDTRMIHGKIQVNLKKLSWNMFVLKKD